MNFKIEKFKTEEKLLSILINNNVYTGGTSGKLINRTNDTVLHSHEKSITSIVAHKNYLACTSYDCTASIFKEDSLFDVIEGSETEIKGVDFNKDGSFISLATRGKSVWLCRFGEYIEIDKILEDHDEDVKGCRFFNSSLFTFGYDTTIKIYNFFELTGTYELVQDITIEHTVWDIIVEENILYVASDNGEIVMYRFEGTWKENKKVKLGILPLYTICKYKNFIVVAVNGGNLVFLSGELEVVHIIPDLHSDSINCIFYSNEDGVLATASDDCSYSLLKEISL